MSKEVRIQQVSNGYIVHYSARTEIFEKLEDVLNCLLMEFEARCDGFGGNSYGKVIVERVDPAVKTPVDL